MDNFVCKLLAHKDGSSHEFPAWPEVNNTLCATQYEREFDAYSRVTSRVATENKNLCIVERVQIVNTFVLQSGQCN